MSGPRGGASVHSGSGRENAVGRCGRVSNCARTKDQSTPCRAVRDCCVCVMIWFKSPSRKSRIQGIGSRTPRLAGRARTGNRAAIWSTESCRPRSASFHTAEVLVVLYVKISSVSVILCTNNTVDSVAQSTVCSCPSRVDRDVATALMFAEEVTLKKLS